MGLDIFFTEDIRNALTALGKSNKRALALAELYGMDAEAARLCHLVYAGALTDVAASFGLALEKPTEPTTIEALRFAYGRGPGLCV